MNKVILICGKICSGKTAYAKSLLKERSCVLLSVDEITVALFGTDAGESHDLMVEKTQSYLFQKSLEIIASGVDVIFDWGFWTRDDRQEATQFFTERNIVFEWHYIDAPDDVLLNNLNKRNREIEAGQTQFYYFDDDLAHRFWNMFEVPPKNEIDVWINSSEPIETEEELHARIYPIILCEYNAAWPEWFMEEKANLERLVGAENIARISHIGSTSVPGLTAKPTIDILLEINKNTDLEKLAAAFPSVEYITLSGEALTVQTPPPHIRVIKGYLPDGFAEKVYHIHVVYPGDHDELRFRDYLIAHPDAAAEYAVLKRSLFQNYEHDRDGYTEAKGEFVRDVVKKAKEELSNGNRT